jgi:hypothetical protein
MLVARLGAMSCQTASGSPRVRDVYSNVACPKRFPDSMQSTLKWNNTPLPTFSSTCIREGSQINPALPPHISLKRFHVFLPEKINVVFLVTTPFLMMHGHKLHDRTQQLHLQEALKVFPSNYRYPSVRSPLLLSCLTHTSTLRIEAVK